MDVTFTLILPLRGSESEHLELMVQSRYGPRTVLERDGREWGVLDVDSGRMLRICTKSERPVTPIHAWHCSLLGVIIGYGVGQCEYTTITSI